MRVCLQPGWPSLRWRGSCFHPFDLRRMSCRANTHIHWPPTAQTSAPMCTDARWRLSLPPPWQPATNCDHVQKKTYWRTFPSRSRGDRCAHMTVIVSIAVWFIVKCSNLPFFISKTLQDYKVIFFIPFLVNSSSSKLKYLRSILSGVF